MGDADGSICFDEWLQALQTCWQRRHPEHHEVVAAAAPQEHVELIHGLTSGSATLATDASPNGVKTRTHHKATYGALQEVGRLRHHSLHVCSVEDARLSESN